jgi:hypothetical protein
MLVRNRLVICRLLIAGLVIAMLRAASEAPAAEPQPKAVRLVIDYGDGVEKHFTAIPFKPGMTALDAMRYAQRHPRGIKFESTGNGATLFVTSIEGVENESGASDERNWIFSVNDKKGNKSCAVTELKPDDVVRWKFEKYQF